MADQIDDLLRAADKGAPIGTTQRYFKSPPTPTPAPTQKPKEKPVNELTDEEYIQRVLGKQKKNSLSDVGEGVKPGQQFAMAETAEAAPTPTYDRKATLDNVRRMYPVYKDVDDDALASGLAAKYPQYQFLAGGPKETKKAEEKKSGGLIGAIKSEWAKTKAAEEKGKPGFVKAIESVTPSASTAAGTVLTAGAGALGAKALSAAPKLGAALGRVAAGTGLGAARDVAKSGGIGWDTVVDAALAGTGEIVPATLSKVVGRAVKGAAAGKALEYVRDRIKNAKGMIIPSIDPAKKLTWDQAIAALEKKTGMDREVTKREIADWMDRFDKTAVGSKAGQLFREMVGSGGRFSDLARAAQGGLEANVPRAAVDVASTERDPHGVPGAFYAWQALKGGLGEAAGHVPVVGPFLRAAERMTP